MNEYYYLDHKFNRIPIYQITHRNYTTGEINMYLKGEYVDLYKKLNYLRNKPFDINYVNGSEFKCYFDCEIISHDFLNNSIKVGIRFSKYKIGSDARNRMKHHLDYYNRKDVINKIIE